MGACRSSVSIRRNHRAHQRGSSSGEDDDGCENAHRCQSGAIIGLISGGHHRGRTMKGASRSSVFGIVGIDGGARERARHKRRGERSQ